MRSYFATDFDASPKNRLLQRLIADVETIVVASEAQSLILENNLIKEYRPRFNVRLKDDKSYPSIAVTLADPFPRVLVTRRRDIPGARYFGPYTDVGQLRRTLAIIRRLYTVRSCPDDLPAERRERPCLDYHIGRCRAPCVGWQSEEDYRRMVEDVVDFLEGPHRRRASEGAGGDAGRQRARGLRAGQGHARRAPLARAAGGARQRRGDRAPATPTSSATRATATTRSACSSGCARGAWWAGSTDFSRGSRRRRTARC